MALWIDVPTGELDESAETLINIFAANLRRQEEIDPFLEGIAGIDLADVPAVGKPRTFWTSYVSQLRADGLLRRVVEKLHAEFPKDGVAPFLTLRLVGHGGWYDETDPLIAQFAGPGRSLPIFGRGTLRQELMLLHSQGYRTLNISGGGRSGKTFSIQLAQLLFEREKLDFAHVDIADWGTTRFTALELVNTIATELRIDLDIKSVDVDKEPDPYTRARLLLQQVRQPLSSTSRVRWVVIDGLDRRNAEPDATAFVEKLMKSIDVDGKPTNMRLLVTGFNGVQPRGSRYHVLLPVTRADVRAVFAMTSSQLGRVSSDDELEEWTDRAWDGFDPAKQDLCDLGDSVYNIVKTELIEAGN
jgi:hypothetical protein